MKIKLVDLEKERLFLGEEKIINRIKAIISNNKFILGEEVELFEENFSKEIKAKYTIAVSSGTDALILALKALCLKPGDEVIIPDNTFIATAEAVILAGGVPVLAPIDPRNGLIDTNAITSLISTRTAGIIPVHIYGFSAEMEKIKKIAEAYDLFILSDAAQAHGTLYKNTPLIDYSHIVTYSFYPGKNLGAYGDAGAVVTNNKYLADRVKKLRNHGRTHKYSHKEIGFNARMDAIQAAILNLKLPHLKDWNQRRREIAKQYIKLLPTNIIPLTSPDYSYSVYHLFVIKTETKRDVILNNLKKSDIEAGIHYPIPLHKQPALTQHNSKFDEELLKKDIEFADKIISLPMHPFLKEEEIKRIIKVIKQTKI